MNSSNNSGISSAGYVTPAVFVTVMDTEGVLCASFEEWQEETLE